MLIYDKLIVLSLGYTSSSQIKSIEACQIILNWERKKSYGKIVTAYSLTKSQKDLGHAKTTIYCTLSILKLSQNKLMDSLYCQYRTELIGQSAN